MKAQRVYMRIANKPTTEMLLGGAEIKHTWYCIEYPPFGELTDLELGVWRAESMLALHRAASRVFYVASPATKGAYTCIKTDGLFEYPSPNEMRNMKGYTPEYLSNLLLLIEPPKEAVNAN